MALEALMQSLLDCATQALTDAGRLPALVFLQPGGEVAWDNCCEAGGQLWVRVGSINPDTQQGNCGPTSLTPPLYVGVIRCAHGLSDSGFPTAAQMSGDASIVISDMEALFDAIRCCFKTDKPGYKIGSWTPLGPDGGCAGGEWQVNVTYPVACECP